jgi:hypothetical protein
MIIAISLFLFHIIKKIDFRAGRRQYKDCKLMGLLHSLYRQNSLNSLKLFTSGFKLQASFTLLFLSAFSRSCSPPSTFRPFPNRYQSEQSTFKHERRRKKHEIIEGSASQEAEREWRH